MTRSITLALAILGFLVICPAAEAIQLVANWRFEGDYTDSSSLANDLSVAAGSPTFSGTVAPGGFSTQSLSFDGNDQLTIASPTGLDFTSGYTFAAWLKGPLPGSSGYYGIFSRGTSTGSDVELFLQKASNDFIIAHNRSNAGSFDYVGFGDPPNDTLYHLAVTYDGSTAKVYYNGVPQSVTQLTASLTPPLVTGGHQAFLGKLGHNQFTPNYYVGLMDEVFVYKRALVPREIDFLMQLNNPTPPRAGILYTGESGFPGDRTGDKLLDEGPQNAVFHGTGVSVDTGPANARFGDGSFHFNSYASSGFSTIELPGSADLGYEFTLAAFVNLAENDVSRLFSAYNGGGLSADELILDCDPSGANTLIKGLRAYVNGVPITASTPITFSTGEYHHLAMTYDNGQVATYLDGQLVASGTAGSGPISLFENLRFGEEASGGANEQFVGNADEILLLYRALSPEQIAALAGAPYLAMVPEPSTWLMLALGGLGLLLARRRRGRSSDC